MPTGPRRLAPILALALLAGATPAPAEALRFFAMGDAPYSEGELLQLEGLLAEVGEARPAFIIHVGDIKSGGSVCTDAYTARVADLFRGVPVPVAYTPGDNEWTDCSRAGGEPRERLAGLRRDLYGDASVLRLRLLGAVQPDPAYPENYYFLSSGALFVALHVVGSNNGLRRKDATTVTEWQGRSAANRALLERAVEAARAQGAKAFIAFFQADLRFEEPGKDRGLDPLRRDLAWLVKSFDGPILVIHGDRHRYLLDQPLLDPETGETVSRLTRLEVPGSPVVSGVWVTYDPSAEEPFRFERPQVDLTTDPPGLIAR
jgi:hypothetical protein